MLEQALSKDEGGKKGDKKNDKLNKSESQKSNFLKKKDRYDPKKALEKGKGEISQKNINKKRLFGKKN